MSEFLCIANWKLQGSKALLASYQYQLSTMVFPGVLPVVCLPTPFLGLWQSCTSAALAAQNVDAFDEGAVTGGVSARMLVDVGCRYVCVGHSERRELFLEDDNLIARKYIAAKRCGLQPIFCIGESLAARAAGQTEVVLRRQLGALFNAEGFDAVEKHAIIIAYEPIWAIGSGEVATVGAIEEAFGFIQSACQRAGQQATMCYGGSVSADNCSALRTCRGLEGLLIGKACLDWDNFERILIQCSGY